MVPKTCSIPECERRQLCRELCALHYGRLRRTGTTDDPKQGFPEKRFWPKVDKSGDCWEWTGATGEGYGRFWLNGRLELAHRVSYILTVGQIPDGMFIDHMCHNRVCVNPGHMRLATSKQNNENIGLNRRNTSGARGVRRNKRDGNWRVAVNHHGREVHIGMFARFDDARHAAIEARNRLFTHNDADRSAP